jgi:hypothetical protein
MDEKIRQLERTNPLEALKWKFRLGQLDTIPVIECPRCRELTVPGLQPRKKGKEPKPTFQATCRNGRSCRQFQLPQEEPWLSLFSGGPFKDQAEYRMQLDNLLFNKHTKKLQHRQEKQEKERVRNLSKSLNNRQWIQHFILKTPLDEVLADKTLI